MSAIARTIELQPLDVTETVGRSALAFVIFVGALVAITFPMPISESWKSSTYEQYYDEDNLDTLARDGTRSRQALLGSLGLLGLAGMAWPGGKSLQARRTLGVVCIAYLAWCAASCLWSDNLGMSSRRLIALACEVAAGLAIAKHASARQFVWIVFACTLAWLGLGIAAELSLGTFRPWQPGYRFAGIFQPNVMGVDCALLTMASLYLASGERRARWCFYTIAAMACAFLFLTGSRTSLAALLVSFTVLWISRTSLSRVLFCILTISMIAACVTLVSALGTFEITADIVAMGREDHDATSLTGRVPLWQELLGRYAHERPLLGHGYGAFWNEDHIAEVAARAWTASHAHSTYIDAVLNVGYVGAALCVMAMLLGLFSAMGREAQEVSAGYGFVAMIVAFGLTAGLLETCVGISWFLSFFGICGVCFLMFDQAQGVHTESLG